MLFYFEHDCYRIDDIMVNANCSEFIDSFINIFTFFSFKDSLLIEGQDIWLNCYLHGNNDRRKIFGNGTDREKLNDWN